MAALDGAGGDSSVVVLATASAPEGEEVFQRWNAMGLDHYASLGLEVRTLSVRNREDAQRADLAKQASEASLIFFSGGNPEYLTTTLRGSRLWSGILSALSGGAVFGGCSAGAMVAGTSERSGFSRGRFQFNGGLGICPRTVFGVHWDSTFMRLFRPAVISRVPAGHVLVGIAESTAILTLGGPWRVYGKGIVEVRGEGRKRLHQAGESFEEGLPAL